MSPTLTEIAYTESVNTVIICNKLTTMANAFISVLRISEHSLSENGKNSNRADNSKFQAE